MRLPVAVTALLLAACGSRGAVTFMLKAPVQADLNPLSDGRVTEFLVKAQDGSLVGAVSRRADGTDPLPLGPLIANMAPGDFELSVIGGTELLGMARIRDVMIRPGVQNSYTAEVRKPFFFIGSALPDETDTQNRLAPHQVVDPTNSKDLLPVLTTGALPATLPNAVGAATVTSDGRFLVAGHAGVNPGLTVIQTASGAIVGELPLTSAPWRLVTAPRDAAIAALDASGTDGTVLVFSDLPGFTAHPASANPARITLRAETPRNAAFAPDGRSVYVLTGDAHNLDPCGSMTPPKANVVRRYLLDGSDAGAWTLPSFAADLAIDQASGAVVISMPLTGQVATIPAGTAAGPVTPTPLIMGTLVCPSALGVVKGDVFVVTAQGDRLATQFTLKRAPLKGGAVTDIPFAAPVYEHRVNDADTNDGKLGFNLEIRPAFFFAYEMAVAPDASRVMFATRTRYRERMQSFQLIASFVCDADIDAVEYGRYAVDTRTGTASYELRSQKMIVPADGRKCIQCDNGAFLSVDFNCVGVPGDRAAGLSAVFGGP